MELRRSPSAVRAQDARAPQRGPAVLRPLDPIREGVRGDLRRRRRFEQQSVRGIGKGENELGLGFPRFFGYLSLARIAVSRRMGINGADRFRR
jgi:hypothetical protein